MNIRKIAAYPAYLILSLLAAALTFLTGVASGICSLLSGICVFFAIVGFIPIGGTYSVSLGIFWLIAAFLLSEYGLPAIAVWLLEKIYVVKFSLQDFLNN